MQIEYKKNHGNYISTSRWAIDQFITFEKNGKLSCYDKDGKQTTITDKVPTGKSKPFYIEPTSVAPTTTTPQPQSPSPVDKDFLMVEYGLKVKKGLFGSLFPFLMDNTKQTFFDDANKEPFNVDNEYMTLISGNKDRRSSQQMPVVTQYLKEISEPGQDNTRLESLI
jgi:hypothetical protein